MTATHWDPRVFRWSAPAGDRDGRPLLVLLHGLGADENDLAGLASYLPPRIVSVAVRAPLPYGDGFAWFDSRLPADEALAAAIAGEEAALAWLQSLDGYSSLGVLGFSQGAAVAIDFVRAAPASIDYAAQLAGFLSPTGGIGTAGSTSSAASASGARSASAVASATPTGQKAAERSGTKTVPVFSGHGDLDEVIAPGEADALAE